MRFSGEFRVILEALDFEETVAFYRDKLGLEQVAAWDRPDGKGTLLRAGGGVIEVVDRLPRLPDRGGAPVARDARLSIGVEDLDEAHSELTGQGVRFLRAPADQPSGQRSMTILGPDGVPISLFSVRREGQG
jgi:catechol 2,3-dioxygenase-like lactoylglutathione lyase family enzyme